MNLTATLEVRANIGASLMRRFEAVRGSVQKAMGLKFYDCCIKNFGPTGQFRPWSGWAPLSKPYAKKVGRSYATLSVSGKLMSAIKVTATDSKSTVSVSKSDCAYALAHQYGNPKGGLPAREYFPIHPDGQVYREVRDLVVTAGRQELFKALKR